MTDSKKHDPAQNESALNSDEREKNHTNLTPPPEEEPSPRVGALSGLLDSSVIERRALMGLLVLFVLYTVYFARDLLLPVILSLLFAGLLQPFVSWLRRFRIPESIGAAIVILLLLILVLFILFQVSGPAARWMERGPIIFEQVNTKLRTFMEPIREAQEATESIQKITEISDAIEDEQKKDVEVVVQGPSLSQQLLSHAQAFIAMIVIIVVLTYFLLASGRDTLERFTNNMKNADEAQRFTQLLRRIQRDISVYLRIVTMINICLGIVVGIAMWLLGMPSPILWGALCGFANFVPYLGAMVSAIILAIVSLLTFDTVFRILLPPLVFLTFTTLEGNFITPTILGYRLTLNPIMVFLSILFWTWVWGIPGSLLAVPSLAALKIISNYFEALKPLRAILG
ncbi:MAG: AI-2E family transporter [bacterium]|jgi:predicted PurR-regulated permease PerM